MARPGTRPFRFTHLYRDKTATRTSAHARLELALADAVRERWSASVVWHAEANPFRRPELGKVGRVTVVAP